MSDVIARLNAALEGRYRVEGEIGAGGMATVYRASDLRHGRDVAIKVLKPELAGVLGADRFLHEIEVAANLRHPHILPLYDSGDADGLLFYVMPHVEGETLEERVERERQLPIDDAVRIMREIADALGFAHDRGIIHRDVKPANIMLEAGHAVLTDFGVAQAVAEADETKLTQTGMLIGTPTFMSPEQTDHERTLDGRSDQYALGCVLYQMLTGEPPFTGPTDAGVLLKHLTAIPPDVTELRPTVPRALAELLSKCLAKEPADRWPSTQVLVARLEALTAGHDGMAPKTRARSAVPGKRLNPWLIGVGAAGLAVVSIGTAVILSDRASSLDPNRVVVTTFENQSGVDSLDVFGGILSDYFANEIARSALVQVVSPDDVRDAILAGATAGATAGDLAEVTGAGWSIGGSYFLQRDSLLIHAQITNTNTGSLEAAVGPFGGTVSAPMEAAAVFRQRLVGALAVVVDADAPAASFWGQPPSLSAYRDYRMARDLWFQDELMEARRLYYRALSVDSTFAAALISLAVVEWNVSEANIPLSDTLVQKAERYREQLAPLHAARLDWMRSWVDGDREGTLRAVRRMMAISPDFALLRDAVSANRPREAVEHALALPDRMRERMRVGLLWVWSDLTQARHMLRDYRNELDDAETARELYRDAGEPLDFEIRALAALGAVDDVRERFAAVLSLKGEPEAWNPGGSLHRAALALRAHGEPMAAREAAAHALDWYGELSAADYRQLRSEVPETRYVAEQWADAEALIDSLRVEFPDDIDVLGRAGTIAARRTDREEAVRIGEILAAIQRPYTFGAPTLWRARIAAVLGEQRRAVDLLEQAYTEGLQFGVWLLHDMDLESLRGYAPFDRFVQPKG